MTGILSIIPIKPEQYDKAGKRHHGYKAGQRGQLSANLCAKDDNAHANKQLYQKSHTKFST